MFVVSVPWPLVVLSQFTTVYSQIRKIMTYNASPLAQQCLLSDKKNGNRMFLTFSSDIECPTKVENFMS